MAFCTRVSGRLFKELGRVQGVLMPISFYTVIVNVKPQTFRAFTRYDTTQNTLI